MNKYQEIMDRITVTDEMRTRVIQNAKLKLEKGETKKANVIPFKRYSAVAASVAVLILGVYTADHFIHLDRTQEEKGEADTLADEIVESAVPGVEEAGSAKELAQMTGIPVSDIPILAAKASDIQYTAVFDMAQIDYLINGQTITFRKSEGVEDNSGDYTDYEMVETIEINGMQVTLKGMQERIFLAVWLQKEYSCSLRFKNGIGEEELTDIISAAFDR